MFISRKKYKSILKRIADLEGQVQSQHKSVIIQTADKITLKVDKQVRKGLISGNASTDSERRTASGGYNFYRI